MVMIDWLINYARLAYQWSRGEVGYMLDADGERTPGSAKMKFIKALVIISACTLAVNVAIAKNSGHLPKDAAPLSSDDIKLLFSGNTIDFKDTLYFFKPDGSLVGIHTDKSGNSFADGKWSVNDNEFCLDSSWHGKDKAAKPFLFALCYKFYKAKNVIWTENNKGGEPKDLGAIYTGQDKKIKKGDLITAKVTALKTQYGY